MHGDCRRRLEKGDRLAGIDHLTMKKRFFEHFVGDDASTARCGQTDAFIETHQMRRGKGVGELAARFQNGPRESHRRTFAIGPSNVNHRRQRQMRITEIAQKSLKPFKPKVPGTRVQRRKALQKRHD